MLNKKNKLLLLATLVASSTTYANALDDTYIQGNLGLSQAHSISDKDFQTAGRIAIGKNFTQNLALELGYFNIEKQKWTVLNHSITTKTDGLDLFVKLQLPLTDELNAYAKIGAAFTNDKIKFPNYALGYYSNTFLPAAALGVAYNITDNLSADVSFESMFDVDRSHRSALNIASVGLKYQF